MLHLNKRSCIVTNLIGIQWFTRESIVSRHGMARGITKDLNRRYKRKWNAAMNESANWKTLFFSVLSLFCRGNTYSLSRGLVPFTRVNAALVGASSETCFSCVCYVVYLQTFCSMWWSYKFLRIAFRFGSCHKRPHFIKWTYFAGITMSVPRQVRRAK